MAISSDKTCYAYFYLDNGELLEKRSMIIMGGNQLGTLTNLPKPIGITNFKGWRISDFECYDNFFNKITGDKKKKIQLTNPNEIYTTNQTYSFEVGVTAATFFDLYFLPVMDNTPTITLSFEIEEF